MANDLNSVVPFRKLPDSCAVRSKRYRQKRKAKKSAEALAPALPDAITSPVLDAIPSQRTSRHTTASVTLKVAAYALAAVGVTMNGWFARSLGSSDIAGWLFLAVGVASDLVALVIPAAAAGLWQASQRATAAIAWLVWIGTFVFAVMAGVGFASVNISDVTQGRASRVTPAVTQAQAALNDALAARDRECKGGVGKFCREREATVNDRQHALDIATRDVADAADPQTVAATKVVSWLTKGVLAPTAEDFALLRLILLAGLPQIGGILLMVGRAK